MAHVGARRRTSAIDYKGEDVGARLRETCPKGVDVFFDNVGGEILDAVLPNLALRGRVAICGAVSGYSDFEGRYGLRNYHMLIMKRGTMRGFLVFDFLDRTMEAVGELAGWAGEGKLKNQVDVVEGLENAPGRAAAALHRREPRQAARARGGRGLGPQVHDVHIVL